MIVTLNRAAARALRSGGAVLLLLAGCSSPVAITGKITYQGKPLPVGNVTFVPEQGGGGFTSEIRNGEYKVTKVPLGPSKIAVMTPSQSTPNQYMEKMRPPPEMLKQAQGKVPGDPGSDPKPVPIPKKFNDPDTSGLTYTVTGGSQVHNIDIPDK
jgi:hypothetical protein